MSKSTKNTRFNFSDHATCIINQTTESHSGFFYAVMWYLATIIIKLDQITNALAVADTAQDKAKEDKPAIATLPSEPDWTKAPDWANFFAINPTGEGVFSDVVLWSDKNGWLVPRLGITRFAGMFNSDNWKNSHQQRPKYEVVIKPTLETSNMDGTLFFDLHADIDGYLAGKNSFITGCVDLLLARMAKEERFSDDENKLGFESIKPFDVVQYKGTKGLEWYCVVVKKYSQKTEMSHMIRFDESGIYYNNGNLEAATDFGNIRTITELEAVEFRKAMEAVYG